jgi:hypothetical protein
MIVLIRFVEVSCTVPGYNLVNLISGPRESVRPSLKIEAVHEIAEKTALLHTIQIAYLFVHSFNLTTGP